jgi:hypothetical protein
MAPGYRPIDIVRDGKIIKGLIASGMKRLPKVAAFPAGDGFGAVYPIVFLGVLLSSALVQVSGSF